MKNLPKYKILVTAAGMAILVLLLSFVKTANAQEMMRSITINPTVAHALNPGQNAEGTINLINNGASPLTFSVDLRDFIIVDKNGTPNLLPPDSLNQKYSASAWIGITPDSFTVGAHQKQEIHYYIQVPPDARPGGHYAAVVYTPTVPKGGLVTGTTVTTQVGTLFYITVNGPVKEQASVTKFFTDLLHEYGPVNILTEITNYGDLHIKPIGTVTVSNMLGKKEVQNIGEGNIFPGGAARDYNNLFGGKFMIGRYEASLVASYGKDNNLPLVASFTFWVFPWKITILLILIVVAIILGIRYQKTRKGHHKEEAPEAAE